jgi:anti-sigma B factor antagonist
MSNMSQLDESAELVSTTIDGDVIIAKLKGPEVALEIEIDQYGDALAKLADNQSHHRVVLRLVSVRFVTSAALGKFITLHRRLQRAGGRLVICEVGPAIEEVLKTARLDQYFHVAPDLATALAAVRQ